MLADLSSTVHSPTMSLPVCYEPARRTAHDASDDECDSDGHALSQCMLAPCPLTPSDHDFRDDCLQAILGPIGGRIIDSDGDDEDSETDDDAA